MSIKLYEQYLQVRETLPFTGEYMPYGWGDLPNSLDVEWMPYSQMFHEFSRELSNSVNAFTLDIQKLAAWAEVVRPLNIEQKADVAREFINTLGSSALGQPYMLRSRFIFATAHLCHQANRAQNPSWIDDLSLDEEIYLDEAEKRGAPWRRFRKLKTRLESVSGRDYRSATNDFRNAYNHRFSQAFLVGITQFVVRKFDDVTKTTSYGFGGLPPLELDGIVDALTTQRDRCYLLFKAFQRLVQEHENAIKANIAL